jgi:hypothetical protein
VVARKGRTPTVKHPHEPPRLDIWERLVFRHIGYAQTKSGDEHGATMPVPNLLCRLSANCPQRAAAGMYDACNILGINYQPHAVTGIVAKPVPLIVTSESTFPPIS